jgi:hypothetical protein
MTEREMLKSDYVMDSDTGFLLKRAAQLLTEHRVVQDDGE